MFPVLRVYDVGNGFDVVSMILQMVGNTIWCHNLGKSLNSMVDFSVSSMIGSIYDWY